MANWWGESPQQEYYRRQNNKEKWGNAGGPIDAVAHSLFKLFAPVLIILIPIIFVLSLIKLFWMYIVSIAVIVAACVLMCRHFRRRGINPGLKIFLTICVSVGLIIGVFYFIPMIENGSLRIPAISRNQTTPVQARYMLVNSDALNVRRGPSTDHAVVGQLTRNTRVQVLNSSGQWWRIRTGNIEGYVNSSFLIEEKFPSAPTTSSDPPQSGMVRSEQIVNKLTSLFSEPPRMGTTRDPEFQRAYEAAITEYDRTHRGVPSGLVLPSGETVQERVESGRVYGK